MTTKAEQARAQTERIRALSTAARNPTPPTNGAAVTEPTRINPDYYREAQNLNKLSMHRLAKLRAKVVDPAEFMAGLSPAVRDRLNKFLYEQVQADARKARLDQVNRARTRERTARAVRKERERNARRNPR